MENSVRFQFWTLLLLSHLPLTALAEARVIPENVLAEWGYHTSNIDEHQTIRQIESLPDREQPLHPRFDLWRECFSTNDAALERMAAKEAEIEAERSVIYKSGLGMLVRSECVYFVSAHGTFFMLEFQPLIMRNLEEYLCSDRECTRSTQLDDL